MVFKTVSLIFIYKYSNKIKTNLCRCILHSMAKIKCNRDIKEVSMQGNESKKL
jgi:hypothetical protein